MSETNAAPKQKLSRALAAKRISRARAKLGEVLHALGDARNELLRNDEEFERRREHMQKSD